MTTETCDNAFYTENILLLDRFISSHKASIYLTEKDNVMKKYIVIIPSVDYILGIITTLITFYFPIYMNI